ncbi:M91 family zinc metallopeptidase [Runella sp. MFBS21]|nr:M91 family zinc metallopeptidase [Runella sp. MFBS21]
MYRKTSRTRPRYDPWGWNLVGIETEGNPELKFKFQGQEEIPELGWYDFGNRMYDPAAVHWNRSDRFADKYFNLSPYSAFGGNPLRYTDMNGDSLVINYFDTNSQEQRVHYGYTQQGGYNFYNADGTAYTGGDKFINQVGSALARLGLGKEGRQMIDFLSNDAQVVSIAQGGNQYDDNTHTVGFNPNSKADIPTEGGVNGLAKSPSYISLGHELAHTEDHLKGTLNKNKTWVGTINYLEAEKYSTHRENQFRSENGLPLRTHYGVIEISPKVFVPDPLNPIVDKKGRSLIYSKVKYR